MTKEQFYTYQQQTFDSFSKKVVRNKSVDILREYKRRLEKEVSLQDIPLTELCSLSAVDTYHPYCKTYYVRGNTIRIYDPALGEVLQYIAPPRRDVILLCYFLELSDAEIGRLLHINRKTVSYRRESALRKLKELLEGLDDA